MDPENETFEEPLSEDEYIEEQVDVEDLSNSNRTMLNALIDLLIQKNVITEEELMERAVSEDLPDYDVETEEEKEETE